MMKDVIEIPARDLQEDVYKATLPLKNAIETAMNHLSAACFNHGSGGKHEELRVELPEGIFERLEMHMAHIYLKAQAKWPEAADQMIMNLAGGNILLVKKKQGVL